MTIHTTDSLRTKRHRLEARIEQADQVIREMRDGATLHLQHAKAGPRWALSNGRQITDEIAKLVTASSSVAGDHDALFDDATSQSFRWWRETE